MDHCKLGAGDVNSSLNSGLLSWARRHWFSFRPSLVFSLLILTLLVLHAGKILAWPNVLQVSMWLLAWAIVSGLSGISSQPRLEMTTFLPTRPVSRRQLYNTLVLANLIPLLVWVMAPVLFILVRPLVWTGAPASQSSHGPAVILTMAVWTLSLYFLGTCGGIYVRTARNRATRFSRLLMFAIAAALLGGESLRHLVSPGLPWALPVSGPALILIAVALAVLFYQAGWRFFRNLDF